MNPLLKDLLVKYMNAMLKNVININNYIKTVTAKEKILIKLIFKDLSGFLL
jgi:hypothetical protein